MSSQDVKYLGNHRTTASGYCWMMLLFDVLLIWNTDS